MRPKHRAYQRARDTLLRAQAALPAPFKPEPDEELPPEVRAVHDAEAQLRTAEEAVADDLQAAWDRNRQALAAAKEQLTAARVQQAQVEVQCGTSARQRDSVWPVLNEAETQAIKAARDAVTAAVADVAAAVELVKSGVTGDQLAEV